MSLQQVEKFLEKVESDPKLNTHYESLETRAQAVSLGAALGFTFTEAEFTKAFDNALDLSQVTGGVDVGARNVSRPCPCLP